MKSIINFYKGIALRFYKWRWLLLILIFCPFILPLLPPSGILALLAAFVCVSSFFLFFVVLSYGPISHFKGSLVWEGWQSMAWLFLSMYAISMVFGVVGLAIFYASNS